MYDSSAGVPMSEEGVIIIGNFGIESWCPVSAEAGNDAYAM